MELTSALKEYNMPKNRGRELLPLDGARVHLTPKPGIDGSDYINASWIMGESLLKFNLLN